MKEFAVILDTALARVQSGEPLETVLDAYPDQGEQLAPLLETALALHSLEPVEMPAAHLLYRQRQAFLAQASAPLPVSPGPLTRLKGQIGAAFAGIGLMIWPPKETRRMSAMIVKLVVILVLGAGTVGGTAAATANSAPGSPLYPVKLELEEARLALAGDPAEQAEMHMAFAGERIQEMQRLALGGEKVDEAMQLRFQHHIENALRLAAQVGDEGQMVGLLQRMQNRFQAQESELSQFQVRVRAQAGEGLAQVQARLGEAARQAGAGVEDPAMFRWRYAHNRPEDAPPFWEEQPGNHYGPPEEVPGPVGEPNYGDDNQQQNQVGPPEGVPGPVGEPNSGEGNQHQNQVGPPEGAPGPGGQPNYGEEGQHQNQVGPPEGAPGPGGQPNYGEDTQHQHQIGAPEDAPGPVEEQNQGDDSQQQNQIGAPGDMTPPGDTNQQNGNTGDTSGGNGDDTNGGSGGDTGGGTDGGTGTTGGSGGDGGGGGGK